MVDHPLVPTDLRQYIQTNKIEEILNMGLNQVLTTMPPDPFSTIAVALVDAKESQPVFERLEATETVFNGHMVTIQIDVFLSYKGNVMKAYTYTVPYEPEEADDPNFFFDDPEQKVGVSCACIFINKQLNKFLAGKELPLQKSALNHLGVWFQSLKERISKRMSGMQASMSDLTGDASQVASPRGASCSPFALRGALEALYYSFGHMKDKGNSFNALYEQVLSRPPSVNGTKVPKLMFTLFNGGKTLGSKVKFRRVYLIMAMKPEDTEQHDALQIYYKVHAAIRKQLSTGKAGEAVFKPSPKGDYAFCAHDNHNDTIKVLEEAINQAGCNTEDRKILQIGLQMDADQYVVPDQNKYDMEGPKNLFEAKQMCDWYLKIISDHPLVTYIEDGIRANDPQGWQMLCQVMKEHNVDCAVRNWFNSDFEVIKEHTAFIAPDAGDDDDDDERVGTAADNAEADAAAATAENPNTSPKPETQGTGNKTSQGKGSKEQIEQVLAEPTEGALSQPTINLNKDKFVPSCVHLTRTGLFMEGKQPQTAIQSLQEISTYANTLKDEEKFSVVFDDAGLENCQNDLVDLAFVLGASHICLQGMGKAMRSAKVDRLQEILERIWEDHQEQLMAQAAGAEKSGAE